MNTEMLMKPKHNTHTHTQDTASIELEMKCVQVKQLHLLSMLHTTEPEQHHHSVEKLTPSYQLMNGLTC